MLCQGPALLLDIFFLPSLFSFDIFVSRTWHIKLEFKLNVKIAAKNIVYHDAALEMRNFPLKVFLDLIVTVEVARYSQCELYLDIQLNSLQS